MNILLITETLHAGGAETFVIRLANALVLNHQVVVFNIHPELSRHELVATLNPAVNLLSFRQKRKGIKQKVDSFLYKLGADYSLLQKDVSNEIMHIIRKYDIQIVHTHLFKPDYYVSCLKQQSERSFRHVTTNHGDYLLYQTREPSGLRHYTRKLKQTLQSLDDVVNISDEQLLQFEVLRKALNPQLGLHKILNGYEAPEPAAIDAGSLGIEPGTLVFGMVARGIPEKGWEILINAFVAAGLNDAKLLLVGDGPETDRLKARHAANTQILFAGYTNNTLGYIKLFDVGVLPSYYKAESLPTVVIEYLYAEKPVLATDIGEIKKMISSEYGDAGLLIPLAEPEVMQFALQSLLRQLYDDPLLRKQLQQRTAAAFAKFSMDHCIQQYEDVYSGKRFADVQ